MYAKICNWHFLNFLFVVVCTFHWIITMVIFLQIFVPIRDGIHYFVYCFNMLHQRIDVLDSNDYFLNCTNKLDRHEAVFAKIPIIDAAFQKVSNRKLPRVHRWKRPFINVTKQALLNDCMFFIWKYKEYYDEEKLTKEINPVSFISTTFFYLFLFLHLFSACFVT